jgi:hypothetical protein
MAGSPFTRDMDSASWSVSTTWPRSPRVVTPLPVRATTICAKSLGSRTRPSTRTMASVVPLLTRPTGSSALLRLRASATSAGVSAAARRRAGSSSTRTWRTFRPLATTRATPSARSRRLTTVWSASSELTLAAVVPHQRQHHVGWALSLSKRLMKGALASSGSEACRAAIFSRTSWLAWEMSASRLNSTTVSLRPSRLLERIILTPAMLLSADSTGLVISVSTAEGEAPG